MTDVIPQSALTTERPDLWLRALDLATRLTGYLYLPKLPGDDGAVTACGGPTHAELSEKALRYWIDYYDKKILEWEENGWDDAHPTVVNYRNWRQQNRDELTRRGLLSSQLATGTPLIAPVPEGAMEWLLHEVGHWVAATPEERALPNYGYGQEAKGVGKAREWQAWAFEEIILAPFGPAREFCPPTHRGGVAFSKRGPMPADALHHIERQLEGQPVAIAQWRALYADWIAYEQTRSAPAWERPN